MLSLVPNDPTRDFVFDDVITFTGNFETVEFSVGYTIVTESVGIVINEIMYNSASFDNEWVELYNDSDAAVSLDGWYMVDDDATHTALELPTDASIPANGYYTIAIYHDAQAEEFPFTPDFDATEICEWNLNNTSDTINLYGPDDNLEDYVTFADSGDWPTLPDGQGSLARIDRSHLRQHPWGKLAGKRRRRRISGRRKQRRRPIHRCHQYCRASHAGARFEHLSPHQ